MHIELHKKGIIIRTDKAKAYRWDQLQSLQGHKLETGRMNGRKREVVPWRQFERLLNEHKINLDWPTTKIENRVEKIIKSTSRFELKKPTLTDRIMNFFSRR